MRGCGIDFIHFTESPTSMLMRKNSSNSLTDDRHKGKGAIQESRSVQSNANQNSSPGPVIDSENWYWVTRDLKVSVVVSVNYDVAYR